MAYTKGLGLLLAAALVASCGGGNGSPEEDAGEDTGADTGSDTGPACAADEDCDDGAFCNGPETCEGGTCAAGAAPCSDGETCDEEADECMDDGCPDADGDGALDAACGGTDCDDDNPSRFPGNTEVCDIDDLDEDCDGRTFGFRDADSDGFADALCCNGTGDDRVCGDDCNDQRPTQHPTEAESCDTFDNDCDGVVDEDVFRTWYADSDGDGFGDATAATMMSCVKPDGFVEDATDCDDTLEARNPGNGEDCDPLMGSPADEDCDGSVDEGCGCSTGDTRECPGAVGVCAGGFQSCVGGSWGPCSVSPGVEICNGLDDNCNGETDEFSLVCYEDRDRDGVAGTTSGTSMCVSEGTSTCPTGYTRIRPTTIDCNESDPRVYPGNSEQCDGKDNDCSSGGGAVPAEDMDGDRYTAVGYSGCTGGSYPKSDCDDERADVSPNHYPGETEPYCPGTPIVAPTKCGPGDWRCGGCGAGDPAASWDWDCLSGPTPDIIDCREGRSCSAGCGGGRTGHVVGTVDVSDCGESRPITFCSGCVDSTCTVEDAGTALVECY